jgi:hypothetical protein
MASFYVCEPGHAKVTEKLENGKVIIKAGIYMGNSNGQKYITKRYMSSKLHLKKYIPKSKFKKMKRIDKNKTLRQKMEYIEGKVLSDLQNKLSYVKLTHKKEHFVIDATQIAIKNFTKDVLELYDFHKNNLL